MLNKSCSNKKNWTIKTKKYKTLLLGSSKCFISKHFTNNTKILAKTSNQWICSHFDWITDNILQKRQISVVINFHNENTTFYTFTWSYFKSYNWKLMCLFVNNFLLIYFLLLTQYHSLIIKLSFLNVHFCINWTCALHVYSNF